MSAIPNELWISVFEELDSPRDLANVVSANKRFRSLGTRVLYRHIIWLDPLKFVRNYPFLQHNTHLPPVTRALTLGISTATPHLGSIEQLSRARAIVNLSGEVSSIHRINTRAHEARILDDIGITNPVDLLAAEDVVHTLYNHAQSFTNLRDLTFNSMVLPNSFYDFVHHFPALDRLAIENCTAPFRPQPTHFHPCDLPITELTIVGIRSHRDHRELRAFGEGKHLRVIRFDSTCYIYKHFSGFPPNQPQNNAHQGFVVALPALAALAASHPPQVPQPTIPFHQAPVPSPHIHTIDVKFPTQKSWQSYISEPHDQFIIPFADFLAKCPRTTNLRIRNHLPWLRLPDAALPNLTHFQGPLTTIKSVVSGQRRIKHLTIRDPTGGLAALEKAFKEVEASGGGPDLESLSVFIGWWDDEILYAVLHHFSGLKRLEIVYKEGDPSEEMLLGMGAHFFGQMPRLWSVRVFKVIPPCTGSVTTPENLSAREYRLRSFQLTLGDLGADGPERAELDDAEFEAAKFGTSSSSHMATSTPEDPEEVVLKELIQAWNRYCPVMREVQLKAGYVWRRADPADVWTQRPIKVNRARNAGFDDA